MSDKISGGFIIKARCIEFSKISKCSPCIRETWNWLLENANFSDQKTKGGFIVKRGQIFRRYSDIRDSLSWFVGFRKESYSESQMKAAMKRLRKELMIVSVKHRQGVMITICNYDRYQTISNYEQTSEQTNDEPMRPPTNKPDLSDKKQECKVCKKETKKPLIICSECCEIEFDKFWILYDSKKDRKKCFARWKKLKESEKEKIFSTLPDYVKNTIKKESDNKTGGFIPMIKNPLTYLNSDSWEDEVVKYDNNPTDVIVNNNPETFKAPDYVVKNYKKKNFR